MKKILIVTAISSVALLSSTVIKASEGVYLGLSYDNYKLKADLLDNNYTVPTATLRVGTKINQYVGFEGVLGLGVTKDTQIERVNSVEVSNERKIKNYYGVYVVGYGPINEKLAITAKLGYVDTSFSSKGARGLSANVPGSDSSVSWGMGVSYNASKDISLQLGYSKLYSDSDADIDVSGFSLGVTQHF